MISIKISVFLVRLFVAVAYPLAGGQSYYKSKLLLSPSLAITVYVAVINTTS